LKYPEPLNEALWASLLIAPKGIEITVLGDDYTGDGTLLIAPKGIEIYLISMISPYPVPLLIAPKGIEIMLAIRSSENSFVSFNRTKRN